MPRTNSKQPDAIASSAGPIPRDVCQCGHSRAEHLGWGGGGECGICGGRFGRLEFRCEPGACDRFTWNGNESQT
jgi:hypothetical protein